MLHCLSMLNIVASTVVKNHKNLAVGGTEHVQKRSTQSKTLQQIQRLSSTGKTPQITWNAVYCTIHKNCPFRNSLRWKCVAGEAFCQVTKSFSVNTFHCIAKNVEITCRKNTQIFIHSQLATAGCWVGFYLSRQVQTKVLFDIWKYCQCLVFQYERFSVRELFLFWSHVQGRISGSGRP